MRKAIVLLICLLWTAPALAMNDYCSGDSETAPRFSPSIPLVNPDQTYCAINSARRGLVPLNIAVSGATSADWLSVQVPQLLAQPAGCVSIMIGINDGYIDKNASQPWPTPPLSTAQLQNNLQSGISQLLAHGHQVTIFTNSAFWWTVNLSTEPPYIATEKEAAYNNSLVPIDAYSLAADCWLSVPGEPARTSCIAFYTDSLGQADWFHPAPAGHQAIAGLCTRPEYANACVCRTTP